MRSSLQQQSPTHLNLFDKAALLPKKKNKQTKKTHCSTRLSPRFQESRAISCCSSGCLKKRISQTEKPSDREDKSPNRLTLTLLWLKGPEEQHYASPETIQSQPRVKSRKLTCLSPCVPPGSIIPAFFSWPPLRRRRRQRGSVWGRMCVCEWERGRRRGRESKNVPNRLFLFSFSFPACTFTSSVMWPGGSLCRSSSSEGLHRACSVSSNCNTTPFL